MKPSILKERVISKVWSIFPIIVHVTTINQWRLKSQWFGLKGLQKAEVYLEPKLASIMERFCEYT